MFGTKDDPIRVNTLEELIEIPRDIKEGEGLWICIDAWHGCEERTDLSAIKKVLEDLSYSLVSLQEDINDTVKDIEEVIGK